MTAPKTECTPQLVLPYHPKLPVVVDFDAPEISSDGGALLLRQLDERLGLTAGFAELLPDPRDPTRVVHSRREQAQQRILQIALGYEDCNDAEHLRHDPVLNTACDRTPNDSTGLSSQPTLSRLDNSFSGRTLRRLVNYLEDTYVAGLATDTDVVILDIDSTADATYGGQQLSFFNAHYNHYMYHPLLVYDGLSGELMTAILRPGRAHASRGAENILKRLIKKIRRRLPFAQVVVRGDSAFCVPRMLKGLEKLNRKIGNVDYIFGLSKNPVLLRLGAGTIESSEKLFEQRGQGEKTIKFHSFSYKARSWPRHRHVVIKAEHSRLGRNPRFVITSLNEFPADILYRAYCERGRCENWIKDLKNALSGDRLSCSTFRANFFRLLLHATAYRLMHALRRAVAPLCEKLGRSQFDTLRLRLLKVGAIVKQSARRIHVRLSESFPQATVFNRLAVSLAPPAPS